MRSIFLLHGGELTIATTADSTKYTVTLPV